MSIYLFNEHRGYTELQALEAALRSERPSDAALADAVQHHAADERRHYRMFRAWFARNGVAPLQVDTSAGYIDRLVRLVTGAPIDDIDLRAAVRDDAQLERLLRLIILTESRGLTQVRSLLRLPDGLMDRELRAMFRVVERDEPSHFEPYVAWLAARKRPQWKPLEVGADMLTHASIVLLKMPRLMLA